MKKINAASVARMRKMSRKMTEQHRNKSSKSSKSVEKETKPKQFADEQASKTVKPTKDVKDTEKVKESEKKPEPNIDQHDESNPKSAEPNVSSSKDSDENHSVEPKDYKTAPVLATPEPIEVDPDNDVAPIEITTAPEIKPVDDVDDSKDNSKSNVCLDKENDKSESGHIDSADIDADHTDSSAPVAPIAQIKHVESSAPANIPNDVHETHEAHEDHEEHESNVKPEELKQNTEPKPKVVEDNKETNEFHVKQGKPNVHEAHKTHEEQIEQSKQQEQHVQHEQKEQQGQNVQDGQNVHQNKDTKDTEHDGHQRPLNQKDVQKQPEYKFDWNSASLLERIEYTLAQMDVLAHTIALSSNRYDHTKLGLKRLETKNMDYLIKLKTKVVLLKHNQVQKLKQAKSEEDFKRLLKTWINNKNFKIRYWI